MKRVLLVAAFAVVVLGAPTASPAAFLSYVAILNGPNEAPPNASPGTGVSFVDIDTTANTMRVRILFQGLLGTTTASHIHAATATPLTGTAGVATTTPTFINFPLGVTSGGYDFTYDMTQASSYNPAYVTANGGTPDTARAALFAAIDQGRSYVNVHTTVFPGGEIRGFLVAVPEPSSVALLGIGLAGLGWMARRRVARA